MAGRGGGRDFLDSASSKAAASKLVATGEGLGVLVTNSSLSMLLKLAVSKPLLDSLLVGQ